LNNTDRVPVNVVVDQVVAVLEVLALGNTVDADQDIDLSRLLRKDGGFFFGARGEERASHLLK
jgi:hypothetical protein